MDSITHFAVRIGSLLTAFLSTLVFHMARDEALAQHRVYDARGQVLRLRLSGHGSERHCNHYRRMGCCKADGRACRNVNAICRYLITIGAILIFIRLSSAVIGAFEMKALVACVVPALVWFICEFAFFRPYGIARRNRSRMCRTTHNRSGRMIDGSVPVRYPGTRE